MSQFNQHEQETLMSKSYSLPTEPEGMAAALLERFNSDKVSSMMTSLGTPLTPPSTWCEAGRLVP